MTIAARGNDIKGLAICQKQHTTLSPSSRGTHVTNAQRPARHPIRNRQKSPKVSWTFYLHYPSRHRPRRLKSQRRSRNNG
jgi:hypothetical protein